MTTVSTAQHAHSFGAPDIVAAVLMNVLMGTNMVATKFAILALGPFTTSVVRFACVFLLCLPWAFKERAQWKLLIVLGLVNGCFMSALMNLALKYSNNVGALSIVAQLSIPFSVLLGLVLLREKVTLVRLGGIALAFGGVVAMLFDPRIAGELPGVCLMAGGALSWALSSIVQRRLSGVPVLTLYAWTGAVGFVALLPFSLVFEPGPLGRLEHMGNAPIGWLAFSIVGVTLVGQGSLAWLLRRHPVSLVMPLTLATPVVSVIMANVFFKSPITASIIFGGCMVAAGIATVICFAPRGRGGLVSAPSAEMATNTAVSADMA